MEVICFYSKCNKPITSEQQSKGMKYCSEDCRKQKGYDMNKNIYGDLQKNGGGARTIMSDSSIKYDEILGGPTMAFGSLDDYHIDEDILSVAIYNHELQQEAKVEHELLVIYDGFEQLQLSHKEHCGVGLATASYRRLKEKNDKKYKERLEYHKHAQWKQNDKRKNKKTNS